MLKYYITQARPWRFQQLPPLPDLIEHRHLHDGLSNPITAWLSKNLHNTPKRR